MGRVARISRLGGYQDEELYQSWLRRKEFAQAQQEPQRSRPVELSGGGFGNALGDVKTAFGNGQQQVLLGREMMGQARRRDAYIARYFS
ncbi:hypothetical protein D3C74_476120 [compost metagenome]